MLSRFIQLLRQSRRAQLVTIGVILLAAVGVVMALAVEDPPEAPETTTTTIVETTTTSAETNSTTTSSTIPEAVSPLNGLPVDDPALLDRRVLAVKMDNHPNARPQSGVQEADVVVEIVVEGITRFMTLWQQSDTEYIGPMRSGRPTDPHILTALNQPTFVISGAQNWVQQLIRSMDVNLVGEVRPQTFRVSGRFAPHNLYANTILLREYADSLEYPDEPPTAPIWEFGELPSTATPATTVEINFVGNIVKWDWDPDTETWLRSADGQESNWRTMDGEEGRIGFPVLVALYTEQYNHSPPGRGKSLPSSRTTGSGQAYVFADGKVMSGTWQRETEQDWFVLTDDSGNVIPVPPGQAWISLVPDGSGLTYE